MIFKNSDIFVHTQKCPNVWNNEINLFIKKNIQQNKMIVPSWIKNKKH